MVDKIISLRIDENIYRKMKILEHINWSSIIRKHLSKEIEKLEEDFDLGRAKKALEDMDKIRKSGIFKSNKQGVDIIREWRNQRRF